jgi:hypothetical protein
VLNIPEMRLYFFPGQYETVVSKPAKPVAAKPVAVKSDRKPGEARIAKNPKKAGQNKPSEPAQPPQSTVVMKGNPTEVITYPVSIGRMDWRTPLGATKIVRKTENPSGPRRPRSSASTRRRATSSPTRYRPATTTRSAGTRSTSATRAT